MLWAKSSMTWLVVGGWDLGLVAGMRPQPEWQALVPEPEGAGGELAVQLAAMTQLATEARKVWAVSSL